MTTKAVDTSKLLSFDFGNRFVKWCTDDNEDMVLHAVQQVTESEFENLSLRGKDSDLFIVNGKHYKIGYRAEAYGETKCGANRYTDSEYYQIFLGVALFCAFDKGSKSITLFAGHAPQDIKYRKAIKESATDGEITVTQHGVTKVFKIKNVECWDEPIGGLMNQILTADGKALKTDLKKGRSIVFDIGGLTIDYAVIENQKVRTDMMDSWRQVNLIQIERNIFYEIQNRYPVEMQSLSPDMVKDEIRRAMITGKYDAQGYGVLDVQDIVDEQLYEVVRFVSEIYNRFGGTGFFKSVVLTGGGAGVVEFRLRVPLGRPNGQGIFLAGERKKIQFANSFGAFKLAVLYRKLGKL